jgi:hypothetical protein
MTPITINGVTYLVYEDLNSGKLYLLQPMYHIENDTEFMNKVYEEFYKER